MIVASKQPKRIFGLDILRASAIILVMYTHSYVYLEKILPSTIASFFLVDGVGIFFVLSGFLIGGILLQTIHRDEFNKGDLINFWLRRWLRTLPNYFLVLSVLALFLALIRPDTLPDNLVSYFFFSQSLFFPHPNFFSEAWSLAVEEWFYLLIPAALFIAISILKVEKKKAIIACIIMVIGAVTVFRSFRILGLAPDANYGKMIGQQVVTRLDGIMYGFLGAFLMFYDFEIWKRYKNQLFFIGLFILFAPNIYRLFWVIPVLPFNYYNLTFFSIGTLLLLPKLSSLTMQSNGIFYRSITFISHISYSMYLINYTIVQSMLVQKLAKTFLINIYVQLLLFWVVTIVFSFLLYRFYEVPMMNLRRHFTKRDHLPSSLIG
ncbi:acyltransferase family protein [Chitinophaga sp. Ak27]|uniref:acyltransferase family protein n=1 Tax=Chitinophaga sp. Ak27 TaxID=2726116 RepID=UPI00145DA6D4|nr:acyltransferase [Chitinophaga sp. Ak27]NLU93168.1 acyltransferase [Chitinophaga sp. Ak27]